MTLEERHFRKYEPILLQWLEVHPAPWTGEPKTIAPITMAAELRRAIRLQLQFNFPAAFDTSLLARVWSICQVSFSGKTVRIGLPERALASVEIGEASGRSSVEKIFLSAPTLDDLTAFLHLLNSNRLKLEVHVESCDPEVAAWFELNHLQYINVSLLSWTPPSFIFC